MSRPCSRSGIFISRAWVAKCRSPRSTWAAVRPRFSSPRELTELIEGILSKAKIAPGAEFSLEADPRVTRKEHLSALAKLGFKRLSLGIQDFDPRVQDIVHRVQSEAQVREVTELAREQGYTSVNYDLIYGLPLQTRDSVRNTIDIVARTQA